MSVAVHQGDCREVLARLPEASVDACVTDPPYHLLSTVLRFAKVPRTESTMPKSPPHARASAGFMGKTWDGGDVAQDPATWAAVYRVLKPGAYILAFSGTRTQHRMVCAIEDAGFEIRDQIGWAYGSGFPKSHDVSKGIDRAAGAERAKVRVDASEVRNPKATAGGRDGVKGATRPWIEAAIERGFHEKDGEEPVTDAARQWSGWGTALKPAWEPICVARKPLIGTVAANVLEYGTGALNIDGCRIPPVDEADVEAQRRVVGFGKSYGNGEAGIALAGSADGSLRRKDRAEFDPTRGRWPANLIHDGSDEVLACFPQTTASQRGTITSRPGAIYGGGAGLPSHTGIYGFNDAGSAARFFYSPKADKGDRLGSKHPTVKPVDLMAYLCRLVTPPGGTVLDPFAGSGTTGMAAMREGFNAILIEMEAESVADITRRIAHVGGADAPLFAGGGQ